MHFTKKPVFSCNSQKSKHSIQMQVPLANVQNRCIVNVTSRFLMKSRLRRGEILAMLG